MNFKLSKDKILVGVAIVIMAVIGLYKSNGDDLKVEKSQEISENLNSENDFNNEASKSSFTKEEEQKDSEVMCHIDGCVKKPGVYSFKKGDRLKDVVALAGGFSNDADTKSVNLAMRVKDEMKIYIPSKSERKENDTTDTTNVVNPKQNTSKELVDINSADSSKLESLPGIGPSKAKKIIEFREKNRFKTIEDIKNVNGIGDKTFESLKNLITVD